MRAGHRDAIFQAHQFGQHLGARNDGNLQPHRFRDFGIVAANRGAGHHHVRPLNVFGAMALIDLRPEIGQPIGDRREPQV